jgi:hypothetical protein
METPSEEAQHTKTPSLSTQDGPKKKKYNRKKPEPKPPKVEPEVVEVIPELKTELDSDLIHYTYKLENELAATKKKLKMQRKKFRHLIHSFAKHVDAKGIGSNVVEEYVRTIGPQVAYESDFESEYEKFYTGYKYQIVDDSIPQQNGKGTSSRKTISKSSSNLLRSNTDDKNTLSNDYNSALSPLEGGLHQQKNANQGSKGASRPRKDSSGKANKADGDGETKKRKYKKRKESEEGNGSLQEVQEIPPPGGRGEKDDMGIPPFMKYDDNRVKSIPPLQQISQQQYQHSKKMDPIEMMLQPNRMDDGLKALMQQMNLDAGSLMNSYFLPTGNQGLGGMQDLDMMTYTKALQELMKMGGLPNPLLPDKGSNDMLNYYPRSFK